MHTEYLGVHERGYELNSLYYFLFVKGMDSLLNVRRKISPNPGSLQKALLIKYKRKNNI